MNKEFKIIPINLLNEYTSKLNPHVFEKFNQLEDSDLSIEIFSFYTSVSAVFSSKIEGENIDLDSFIKYKRFGNEYLPDYTQKIDDLYEAYIFAMKNIINEKNLNLTHSLITKHILKKTQQGKFRTNNMFVVTKDGKIEYVATAPEKVKEEMRKFYSDLKILLVQELTFGEVLYYAAMIHLVFVKIHPFNDGNGRMARLIEKWFIAQKLGEKAWYVQSEKNYYDLHQTYYQNIRKLGLDYEELDFEQSLSFLLMLPNAINKINSNF
ncbi:hypothetical protein A5893_08395 [Pedobacter psychrophilus]|uniref:Fido domain-containing protein n=1 Tax=Pedobacter psychrophilus TaxID=1826909 RepID=A0A179DEZ8_9SPHI|nr:Fic family protein [Pedobacter psychrophilus]OAQ39601.1 hypothetical protein A5893_08395 [Pedobacter psychrophilus]